MRSAANRMAVKLGARSHTLYKVAVTKQHSECRKPFSEVIRIRCTATYVHRTYRFYGRCLSTKTWWLAHWHSHMSASEISFSRKEIAWNAFEYIFSDKSFSCTHFLQRNFTFHFVPSSIPLRWLRAKHIVRCMQPASQLAAIYVSSWMSARKAMVKHILNVVAVFIGEKAFFHFRNAIREMRAFFGV